MNLALAKFYLFPRLQSAIKGKAYEDIDDIIVKLVKQLKEVSKNMFQEFFQKL